MKICQLAPNVSEYYLTKYDRKVLLKQIIVNLSQFQIIIMPLCQGLGQIHVNTRDDQKVLGLMLAFHRYLFKLNNICIVDSMNS